MNHAEQKTAEFWREFPILSRGLSGISGHLKGSPDDFEVSEIPLYEPCGEGEHIYLRLRRRGQNTQDLVRALGRLLQIPDRAIGTAGLKDKHALSTQTFSVHLPKADEALIEKKIRESLDVECLSCMRHTNKLKTGHLRGNAFRIFVSGTQTGDSKRADEKAEFIKEHGVPNYYGEQRFGRFLDNHILGKKLLLDEAGKSNGTSETSLSETKGPPKRKKNKARKKGWKTRLLLSAYQSFLFNKILARRIEEGLFDTLLAGDVAKKTDSGGLFVVEDPKEAVRFEKRQIEWTGPIFGSKMKAARELPGHWEEELLKKEELSLESFKKSGLEGTRRPGRLFPENLQIETGEGGLWFSFELPAGSYATMVLREFFGS